MGEPTHKKDGSRYYGLLLFRLAPLLAEFTAPAPIEEKKTITVDMKVSRRTHSGHSPTNKNFYSLT